MAPPVDHAPTRTAADRHALERDAFVDLASTADRLQARFTRCLKPFDLSVPQFNVLRAVALADHPVPVGYVADAMLTRTPDMTRLLDRLEARGLIERAADPQDRRSVRVSLTRAGRSLHTRAGRAVDDEHRRQWTDFTDDDLVRLRALLHAARTGLDAGPGDPLPDGPDRGSDLARLPEGTR